MAAVHSFALLTGQLDSSSSARSSHVRLHEQHRCRNRGQRPRNRAHTKCQASAGGPGSLFIFGLGYSTLALAREAQHRQWVVTSTARSPAKFAGICAPPQHQVVQYDPAAGVELNQEGLELLEGASHVVSCIPPLGPRLYDPVLRSQLRLLRRRCASTRQPLQWFGYLSSTGVYGDWQGQWVDESSETRAATSRGVVRLEHECAWQQLQRDTGLPLHVFRLGGIYGPRRSVLDALKQGVAERSNSQERRSRQRYTARVHVADICGALIASMAAPQAAGGVWNVVDDVPAPRQEVEEYAMQLLHGIVDAAGSVSSTGAEVSRSDIPAVSSANDGSSDRGSSSGSSSSGGARREMLEEKRVSNAHLKALLGGPLLYPSYTEGLAAVAAGNIRPFTAADLHCLYGAL